MKRIWLLALVIGTVNALTLYVFELISVDMTNWLWNDVLGTDQFRWRVIPAALVLGLALTGLIKLLHDKRIVPVEADLLEESKNSPDTIPAISVVLAIGAMCLLAGGSIGPEASLMAASAGIGAYTARRWKLGAMSQVITLASIGALLVAFIGSLLLALVPFLILLQQAKSNKQAVQAMHVSLILVACLASFVIIQIIDYATGNSAGYGSLPSLPAFQAKDFLVAIVVGFVSGFLALCLNWFIKKFWQLASWLDDHKLPAHDWLVGIIFSAILGSLYLIGGRSIQFSGSIGSSILVNNAQQYGALALVGLIIAKLLATAWSKGTGYRGGLVFPSIYIGIALGLLAGHLVDSLSGAGAIVGGISGMMTAVVGSPIMAGIFLIAVLPIKLWPVGICALVGTSLFTWIGSRIGLYRPNHQS